MNGVNKNLPDVIVSQIIGKNGGEDTLAHWPTAPGMMTIDEASCEVLKFLDKNWGAISSSGRFFHVFFFFFCILSNIVALSKIFI